MEQELNERIAALEKRVAELEAEKKRGVPLRLKDPDFIDYLKMNPAFRHLNIDTEIGHAHAYCVANHKAFTQTFIVRWLGRNRNMGIQVKPTAAPQPAPRPEWAVKKELNEKLAKVQADIDRLKGQASHDAFGAHYTRDQRDKLMALNAKKKEIQSQLDKYE